MTAEVTRLEDGRITVVVPLNGLSNVEAYDLSRRLHRMATGAPFPDTDRVERLEVAVAQLTADLDELREHAGLANADDAADATPGGDAEAARRVLAVNGVRVDLDAYRVHVDDREIEVSPRVFDLLVLLMRNAGRVVTTRQMIDDVWDGFAGDGKTVSMHIALLRRALGDDAAHPRFFVNLRGVGYRFETGPTDHAAPVPVGAAGQPGRRTA